MGNSLNGARSELLNLVNRQDIEDGVETAEKVIEVASKGASLIKDAVAWSGAAADKAADVQRLK